MAWPRRPGRHAERTGAARCERRSARCLVALALLVVVGGSRPPRGAAQEQAAPAPEPTPTVVAIAGPRIAQSAEETRNRLRELEASTAALDPAISAIEAELPGIKRALDRLAKISESQVGPQAPAAILTDIENRGISIREELQGWQHSLARSGTVLEGSLGEVRDLRERWGETRKSAAAERLPAELIARIDSTVATIEQSERQLRGRRGDILTLQGTIAQQQSRADDVVAWAQARRAEQRRRLLALDSPPLWTALGALEGASLRGEMVRVWHAGGRATLEFVRDSRAALALDGLLILVMLAGFLALRARTRTELGADEVGAVSAHVFARPLSAALLLSLLLFSLLHPRVPVAVFQLAGLVAAIPVLRLLPRALFPSMRPALVALTGLLLLDRIVNLTMELSLLQRLMLVVETVLAGAAFRLVPRAAGGRPAGPWPGAVAIGARCALPVLATSLALNVAGNVSLARLLTGGLLASAYVAAALFTVALVVDAALAAALRSPAGQGLRMVRDHGALVACRVRQALHGGLGVLWIWVTVQALALREPLVAAARELLAATWSVGAIELTLGGLVRFVLTLAVVLLLARGVPFVLKEEVLPRVVLAPGVPDAIVAATRYVLVAGGVLLAAGAAGLDFGRIALLAGALSVGIGFGLQNVVNNFVSGLILLVERPIRVGDVVEVGTVIGDVRRIGIRSSTIRTPDGADAIVPNGTLISDRLVNWTLSDRQRRVELPIGVAYGTDPQTVIDLLLRVVRAHPGVLSAPPPAALFIGFGESSLDFSVRFWTARFENWFDVRSEVAVALHGALREAGIAIPFPQRDLHLRSIDADPRALVDGDAPAASAAEAKGPAAGGHAGDRSRS